MSTFRKIYTKFWKDGKVIEELTPEDKFFFIYLLTNPATTQIGIYQITKKQMSFELGYSIETINSLMDRFENHHKLIKYNSHTREIGIKHWGRYNLDRGGKPMIDCIKKELQSVSDISLIKYVSENIKRGDIEELFIDFLNKNDNLKSNEEFESKDITKDKFNYDDTYNESYNDTWGTSRQVKVKDKVKVKEEEKEEVKDKEKDIKNSNIGKYAKLYEQNIGLINGVAYEWLSTISEEIDIKLFKKAIEIATDRGKCSKGYIGGIIRQWLNNNIKTYDALKAYELNIGGQSNDRKSKYARAYEIEDEPIYQKPTKEQLKRARELSKE